MSIVYVKFQSDNELVQSDDCTTRWSDNIGCNIPMSGLYENKYTNLMIMTGDEKEIIKWVEENSEKVEIISEEEGDFIGQIISPEGVIVATFEFDEKVETISGLFTMSVGQTWTPIV